jgi:hypothetical protein
MGLVSSKFPPARCIRAFPIELTVLHGAVV